MPLLVIAALPLLAGCVGMGTGSLTLPPSAPPAETWWKYETTQHVMTATPDLTAQAEPRQWTLTDVVNIALETNPATRAAWNDARAAEARYQSLEGGNWPTVSLDATLSRFKQLVPPNTPSVPYTTYGPTVSLSYLLYDFGGREGAIENAKQLYSSASWLQNAAIQDVILQVETAYFRYMATKATLAAQQSDWREAQTNLEVANQRHQVGLATIADVLQAKTSLSRTRLLLQTTEGSLQTTRGALALAMGLPATTSYDIEDMPKDIPMQAIADTIETLIDHAEKNRPELVAAHARVQAANAGVLALRSQSWPALKLTGSFGRSWFPDPNGSSDSYTGVFTLHIPLFTGFGDTYRDAAARRQAEAEQERAKDLEQRIIFQVFSAYYGLQTATQQVVASNDLMASAEQSEEVTLARYKEGVGSIIDLLSSQRDLEEARAQQIDSRWGWYMALVQMAHDAGLFGPHGENPFMTFEQAEVKP